MTRIIAGDAKGRTLRVPGEGTRPTSAKIREALFSKLEAWGLVRGARILDLFAGSGALGLEAFSRGAGRVDLVEKARQAQRVVEENIRSVRGKDAVKLHRISAEHFLAAHSDIYDVIFVDPPYSWQEQRLTELLAQIPGRLSPDGVVVVERDSRSDRVRTPDSLVLEDERRWGDTTVYILGLPALPPAEAQSSK